MGAHYGSAERRKTGVHAAARVACAKSSGKSAVAALSACADFLQGKFLGQPRSYFLVSTDDYLSYSCPGHGHGDLPQCQQNGQSTQASRSHPAASFHLFGPTLDHPRAQSLIPPKRAHARLLAFSYFPPHLVILHSVQLGYPFLTRLRLLSQLQACHLPSPDFVVYRPKMGKKSSHFVVHGVNGTGKGPCLVRAFLGESGLRAGEFRRATRSRVGEGRLESTQD